MLAAVTISVPTAARAELPILVDVGVRVGYAFGAGWTFGPTLGAGIAAFAGRDSGLLTGLTSSAFVILGPNAPISYAVSVGPVLTFLNRCPVFRVDASGGWLWSFSAGRPTHLGGQVAFSPSLSSRPNPMPYYDPPNQPRPFFTGPTYRYLGLASGAGQHEIGAALTVPYFPGRATGTGIGSCGGN